MAENIAALTHEQLIRTRAVKMGLVEAFSDIKPEVHRYKTIRTLFTVIL